MTVEEAKQLKREQSVFTYDIDKRKKANRSGQRWYRARVTSVKTWKRTPEKVDVHIVYGLRDYMVLDQTNIMYWHLAPTHNPEDAS
jgi:hypothetical protein